MLTCYEWNGTLLIIFPRLHYLAGHSKILLCKHIFLRKVLHRIWVYHFQKVHFTFGFEEKVKFSIDIRQKSKFHDVINITSYIYIYTFYLLIWTNSIVVLIKTVGIRYFSGNDFHTWVYDTNKVLLFKG